LIRKLPDPVSTTLSPTDDTYIQEGYPTTNRCSYEMFWVGYDGQLYSQHGINRALIKFSLANLPPGALVQKAQLILYRSTFADYQNQPSRVFSVYRVGSAWSECSATWSAQPAMAEFRGSGTFPNQFNDTGYAIDITGLLTD